LSPSTAGENSDGVLFYRAVSPVELTDIQRTGTFNPFPNGSEMKQFWLSGADALTFGRDMNSRLNINEYQHVAALKVTMSTYSFGVPGIDSLSTGTRPSVTYDLTTLQKVNIDARANGVKVIK
jgi:hypothetical protein